MISIKNCISEKIKENDVFKAVVAIFSVNLFSSLVGMAGSFVQGYFVTAEELGFFKQFGIVTGYIFFLHLGIFNAVERLYPLYTQQGDIKNARRVVEIGNAWMLMVCGSVSLVFVGLSFYNFFIGNWQSGLCWIVQIVLVWTSLYGGFFSATYRSGKEFQRLAKANVFNPVISLILIPLYCFQPFITMVLRNCTGMVSTIRLYLSRPVKVKLRFSFKEWIELIKQGLPIFTATYIMLTGLDSIRGTIILLFLTQTDLGYWSFAYMCILLVEQLTTSVTSVYLPRIVAEFAKTKSYKDTLQVAKKPVKITLLIMLILIPTAIVVVYFFLPLLLPNYSACVPIIIILLFSVPMKAFDAFNNVLVAGNRKKDLNTIALISTGSQIAISLSLAYLGVGVSAFAYGYLFSAIIRTCLLYMKIKKLNKEIISG